MVQIGGWIDSQDRADRSALNRHHVWELGWAIQNQKPGPIGCVEYTAHLQLKMVMHIVLQQGLLGCVEATSCVGIRLGHSNAYNYIVKNGGWIDFQDRADRVCGTDIMCEKWFGATKN